MSMPQPLMANLCFANRDRCPGMAYRQKIGDLSRAIYPENLWCILLNLTSVLLSFVL